MFNVQVIRLFFIALLLICFFDCISKEADYPVVIKCETSAGCKCKRVEDKIFSVEKTLDFVSMNDAKNWNLIACCYHQVGVQFHRNGKFLEAIKYYNLAENLKSEGEDSLLWTSKFHLGLAYFAINEFKKASIYLKKSFHLKWNKSSKDSINILINLAYCYDELGDREKAIEHGLKAIQIDAQEKYMAKANSVLAGILGNRTNDIQSISNSIEFTNKALELSLMVKDYHNVVSALMSKGSAYRQLGEYKNAILAYSEVDNYTSLTEYQYLYKAISQTNIASVYYKEGKHNLAIDSLKQSLSFYSKFYDTEFVYDYAAPYENLADNYTVLQQFNTSLLHYQKALINLTNNFRNENIFQNPNPKDTSLFSYSNPDIIRVLHLKATAAFKYYKQNNNQEYLNLANQTYETAFNFHDTLQRDISTENSRLFQAKNIVSYIENALNVTYKLQENGQDVSESAFRFMEKNKATVLLQSMNEADALQYANLPNSLLKQEKNLKIALAFHKKQFNEAIEYEETMEIERLDSVLFEEKQQYQLLIDSLENNYPDYYRLKYQQNQTQLKDIQNQLDNETALLEYFVGDSSIYILSIQKDKAKLTHLKKPKEWEQVLNDFRLALTDSLLLKDGIDRYQNLFAEGGHKLFQWLLDKPLNDLDNNINRLQIIPDAELNSIPFELLLTEKVDTTQIDYKKLPYVLRNKSVGYLYAGAFLKGNQKKASEDTLLSLAGYSANYQNSTLGALPFSEESVNNISQKFKGAAFTNASKKNFIGEAAKYKTLLFAMHAKLDDKNALNSALVFSETADSIDNQLRAADLYNTSLNAEMAVLSACETGVGKINKGEGVMSLSRAFTYAGCPSLVMSLWSIPNKSTSQLTESFFDYLNEGLTKDKALQQAKLTYLENALSYLSHPAYWAGLVATGDLSPVDIDGESKNSLLWVIVLMLVLGLALLWFYKR